MISESITKKKSHLFLPLFFGLFLYSCNQEKVEQSNVKKAFDEKIISSNLFKKPLDSIFFDYSKNILNQIPWYFQNKIVFIIDFFRKDSLSYCEISSLWDIPALCIESDYSIICTSTFIHNKVVFISNINDTLGLEFLNLQNWHFNDVYHVPEFEQLANIISIKNTKLIFKIINGEFHLSRYERYLEQNDDYFNSIPTPCEINFPPEWR